MKSLVDRVLHLLTNAVIDAGARALGPSRETAPSLSSPDPDLAALGQQASWKHPQKHHGQQQTSEIAQKNLYKSSHIHIYPTRLAAGFPGLPPFSTLAITFARHQRQCKRVKIVSRKFASCVGFVTYD